MRFSNYWTGATSRDQYFTTYSTHCWSACLCCISTGGFSSSAWLSSKLKPEAESQMMSALVLPLPLSWYQCCNCTIVGAVIPVASGNMTGTQDTAVVYLLLKFWADTLYLSSHTIWCWWSQLGVLVASHCNSKFMVKSDTLWVMLMRLWTFIGLCWKDKTLNCYCGVVSTIV